MGFAANVKDDEYRVNTMGMQAPPLTELTPDSMFENLSGAVGSSVVGGLASAARFAGDALMTGAKYAGYGDMVQSGMFKTPEEQQQYLDAPAMRMPLDESLQKVQDWAKIDPRVTGSGSQIAGSVVHGVTVFGLGTLAGGPIAGAGLMAGSAGYDDYRESKAAGVDDTTALEKAGITAGFAALGAIPAMGGIGSTLLTKIATGAGINTGFGIAQRTATSSLLENAGYKDMANQYKALDAGSLVADAILGSAFGGWSHIHEGRATGEHPKPTERPSDALVEQALETRRQELVERGGPGIPTTPEHATLNTDLQDRALGDLLRAKDPEVTAEEANAMVDNVVVDPERVQLNNDYVQAGIDAHGPIADFSEPERLPPTPKAEPVVSAEPETKPAESAPPLPEEVSKLMSPMASEQMAQLAANHPDMEVQMPDGSMVKATDLQRVMSEQFGAAQKESVLHDVAVACFLRTL